MRSGPSNGSRSVTVTAGGTSRIKTVSVEGDPDALARRIAELLPGS